MIRQAIAGIALMTAANGHAATGEREFAEQMLERLRGEARSMELRVSADDPLALEMKHEGKWGDARINLHRFHAFCADATREDCEAVLANFVTRVTAPRPEPAAANLRVVVRNEGYLDHLLQTQPADALPIYRQIGDDLFALLAFSGPSGVLIAIPEQLQALELGDDAAWALAREQTRAMLPPLPKAIDLVRDQVIIFEDGDLLTSLLADTEAWRRIAAEVGPELVVTAVSDRFVFAGVLPDHPRMREFKQVVREDCEAEERCLSPNVYRFRDGRWAIAD